MSQRVGYLNEAGRDELARALRLHGRATRSGVGRREVELRADFEEQLAARYEIDDVCWSEVAHTAEVARIEADDVIAMRCVELGIPHEFRPRLELDFYDGQYVLTNHVARLRQRAQRRIREMARATKAEINDGEARLQTELLARDITSDEAPAFLTRLPSVEELMPMLQLWDLDTPEAEAEDPRRRRGRPLAD
jgi:hypothetical protein